MRMTKKRIMYTILVTLIVVFTTTFSVLMTLERTDYRNFLQGEYSKNMYELVDAVNNIRTDLDKAAISASKDQQIIIFEDIFRYSSIANDKLHSLPLSQDTINSTSKYLTQVGDFCYSLVRASSEGRSLNSSEYAMIDKLSNQSYNLSNQLQDVLADINIGKVRWGEIRQKMTGVFAMSGKNIITQKFVNIQKQIAQYPTLIYDGPFSDNTLDIKPRISSAKTVSESDARKVFMSLVSKESINSVTSVKNKGKTPIDSYEFNATVKGDKNRVINCTVSKNGGKINYLIDSKNIGKPVLKQKDAVNKGTEYLKKLGYKDMVSTYVLNYGNSVLINYIYKQDNVYIYPDQVELKIAMDNGDIIGVQANKYLTSHVPDRKIAAPKITEAQALKKVSPRVKVNSRRLAIIPTETNKEVLCYEFGVTYNNDNYFIYINADNGYEQKILQIINTPNGQLTM